MRATRVVGGTLLAVVVLAAPQASAARELVDAPGVIVGIDAATGDEQWRTVFGKQHGAALRTSATNGVVFAERRPCLDLDRAPPHEVELVALDAKTGEKLWARDDVQIAGRYVRTIDMRTSTVLTENGDGDLVGIRPRSGEELWTKPAAENTWLQGAYGHVDWTYSVAAQAGGIVLMSNLGKGGYRPLRFGTANPRFEGWDETTGEVVWRRDIAPDWEVENFTATEGNELFLIAWQYPTADGSPIVKRILSIDLTDGSLRTVTTLPVVEDDRFTYLAATPDTIVVNAPGHHRPGPLGTLLAIDRETGAQRWVGTGTLGDSVIADTVFVVYDRMANAYEPIYGLDARSGTKTWEVPVDFYGPYPSSSGSTIVSTDTDPTLTNPIVEHRALVAKTGRKRWSIETRGLSYVGTTRGVAAFATGCLLTTQD